MSGRIRQLKPEIYLDDEFEALEVKHLELRLFKAFSGLWCHSDREGRFEWKPAQLKAKIMPYWGGDFGRVLDVLTSAGYVHRYMVDGRVYGWSRSFRKHQRPGNREPDSCIPPPPEQTPACLSTLKSAEARAGTPTPIPTPTHNPDPDPDPLEGRPDVDGLPPIPGLQRVIGSNGVARVYELPDIDPPQAYLDEALMAGVAREQAASTWNHYRAEGLPEKGVQRLYPWLIKASKERANRQARAPKSARSAPTSRVEATLERQAARVEKLRAEEAAEEARAS